MDKPHPIDKSKYPAGYFTTPEDYQKAAEERRFATIERQRHMTKEEIMADLEKEIEAYIFVAEKLEESYNDSCHRAAGVVRKAVIQELQARIELYKPGRGMH